MNKHLIMICAIGLALATATGRLAAESDEFGYPSLEEVERLLVERTAGIRAFQVDVVAEMSSTPMYSPHSPFMYEATSVLPMMYEGRYTYVRTDDRVRTRLHMRPAELSLAKPKSVSGEDHPDKDVPREDYLDHGYVAAKTDFALGHLVHGIASKALGREDEAFDHFHEAVQINARLKELVEVLKSDEYNTVLIVGSGMGPRKIAFGPDKALARFVPTPGSESTANPLVYRVNGSGTKAAPVVCDVNKMAMDHMWNNLEDVRLAKSAIGRHLMKAGEQLSQSGDIYLGAGGLAIYAVGAAVRASARADTRYCEAMPQRFYLVPLNVTVPDSTIELGVRGCPGSKIVLPGLAPPGRGVPIAVHYVHLLPAQFAASWATSSRVLYANDACEARVDGDDLPYILGGRCVRRPSETVLAHYRQAGNLTDLSLSELEDLYRAEGIKLTLHEEDDRAGLHILEGGTSLEAPVVGSTGFKRLFCQEHSPYAAQSPLVQELIARIQAQRGVLVSRAAAAK